MSITRDLERARSAFNKPTLAMLRGKWAPVVLAVFSAHFTRERPRIATDRFHTQVEISLDELQARGEDVPEGTPRDLCRRWVNEKWLSLTSNEDNVEEYSLTSHAQEALDYVNRLSAHRAMFGESRIRTILDTARNCAIEASPDRDLRMARLEEEIERLTTERDRIADGGDIEPASPDRMLEEYLNLADLLSALPSDFIRVSETFKEIHRDIVSDFRTDDRRSGDVLDRYLTKSEQAMESSAEGRAFTGAVALLRDPRLLEELKADLDTILEHDFAEALMPVERTNLRRTAIAIWNGIESVLEQRRRLSQTLRTHMTRQDAVRDRELDEVLRGTQTELATWMETSRPRARVPLDLGLASIDVTHLRERVYNPADHTPPPPLAQPEPEEGLLVSFDELRKQGGPAFADMLRKLADRLDQPDAGAGVDAADMFNDLPEGLRRPVEVLGLIHLSASTDTGIPHDPVPVDAVRLETVTGDIDTDEMAPLPPDHATVETALYETVRPDGTRTVFRAPRLTFDADDLTALSETLPATPTQHVDEGHRR